jgi:bile acid:Na+ symporter, BASS family
MPSAAGPIADRAKRELGADRVRPRGERHVGPLSLSPVPPVLPNKALRAGADHDYTIGLLGTTCVLSIAVVPASFMIADLILERSMPSAPISVAGQVLASVLAPLTAGLALHRVTPRAAALLARYVSLIATLILVGCLLPVLVATGGRILSLPGRGLLIAFASFSVVSLLIGHWLGGPRLEQRAVLALPTASRHLSIARAIAHGAAPDETLVGAALLAYLIIAACAPDRRGADGSG